MNKSFFTSQNLFLSPLLPQQDQSPYLSPFPNNFRKMSDDLEDFIGFRLEQNEQEEPLPHEPQEEISRLDRDLEVIGACRQQELREADSYEPASPLNSNRCEVPSTKFQEAREEYQPPYLQLSAEYEGESRVEAMIEFLVQHSQLKEDLLAVEARRFAEDSPLVAAAFKILAGKFRKLRKTKEEMTKYCMRKAFKFVGDRGRKDRSGREVDLSVLQYFSQDETAANFSIPFKKNSTEKTMNGAFLKRVFSCRHFAEDYREFLVEFRALMTEDNDRKVKYLTQMVEEAIQKGDAAKIDCIKRLPWTSQILQQAYQLAVSLAEHERQGPQGRRARKAAE